jgi:hypothetical protein
VKKVVSGLALILALGLLAILGGRGVEFWALHRNVAATQSQARELRKQYDQARRRADVAEAVARRQHQPSGPGGTVDKPVANAVASPSRNSTAAFALKAGTDPALFAATVYTKWGLLLRRLSLTPENQDRLIAIESTYEAAKAQIHQEAAEVGASTNSQPFAAEISEASADQTKDVRALLTPDEYAAFKAYSQQMSVVTLVSDLEKDELQSNLPDATASALIDILANASRKDSYGWIQYGTVDWSTAMPQAQAILTPEQFQGLQSLAGRKAAQWQIDSFTNGARK